MLVTGIGFFGGVGLLPHEVTYGPEPNAFPRREELLGVIPSVKAYAEAIGLYYAVELAKGWLYPASVPVAVNGAATSVVVIDEVRWIGQYEVDALVGKRFHHVNAVAVYDLVYVVVNWFIGHMIMSG